MKINFAAFAALLLANVIPQTAVYAQGAPPGQPYIQVPIPGIPGVGQPPPEQRRYQGGEDRERREHCERLGDREDEMRDRLQTVHGEERERLEYRIREVHEEREHCWRR
jgi:hypothetical protein